MVVVFFFLFAVCMNSTNLMAADSPFAFEPLVSVSESEEEEATEERSDTEKREEDLSQDAEVDYYAHCEFKQKKEKNKKKKWWKGWWRRGFSKNCLSHLSLE